MDDWLTPKHILEVIENLMGQIYLDPCAEPAADRKYNVPALVHYALPANGLELPWKGNVFCNPPYSRGSGIEKWIEKAVWEARNPQTAIAMLLPAKTDTKWIRPLARFPRTFLHGRLKFGVPPGQKDYGAGTFPSMIVGLNIDALDMHHAFLHTGDTYENVIRPLR